MMKLGPAIGYSGPHLDVPGVLVQRAEELGFDFVHDVAPCIKAAAATAQGGG